jgi:hypothetical protein
MSGYGPRARQQPADLVEQSAVHWAHRPPRDGHASCGHFFSLATCTKPITPWRATPWVPTL